MLRAFAVLMTLLFFLWKIRVFGSGQDMHPFRKKESPQRAHLLLIEVHLLGERSWTDRRFMLKTSRQPLLTFPTQLAEG
jgi:hypothetical protein